MSVAADPTEAALAEAIWRDSPAGYDPDTEALKGRKVRIPKGSPIHSMQPGVTWLIAKRAQTITVDHVLPGHTPGNPDRPEVFSVPCVRWAGTGGYWRAVPACDVEIVDD